MEARVRQEFASEQLAHYKVPTTLTIVDQLPTTSTGKVRKFLLREHAERRRRETSKV